jgi:CRP/FNR family transcriptional regulator, cyclic AMP receptor protein
MSVSGFEQVLREHPFFRDMDEGRLGVLAGCAANVVFQPGEFIVRAEQKAERFYVIRFGRVALESWPPEGGAIPIETVEAGDVLGWSWLFPPYKWHFDARAQTLVRALTLDGVCLREKCERDPSLGYDLVQRFAQVAVRRLEATQLQLLDLYVNRP